MKKENIRFLYTLLVVFVLVFSFAEIATSNPANDPPSGKGHKTLDEQFLDVEEMIPEFGGMFVNEDVMNVYLMNPAKKPVAEVAIASVFGQNRIPPRGIQVLQGQYKFSQLKEYHMRMGGLLNIPGVVFTDVDESSNRIKVGVESLDVSEVVEQKILKLGIPRGSFNIVQTDPTFFATKPLRIGSTATLRDYTRPLKGGIQIAFPNIDPNYQNICTLGINGILSGINGFVTNSHCTFTQGGIDTTSNGYYYQPLMSYDRIAIEMIDPLYNSSNCPGGTVDRVCRWSDSAYAQVDSGVDQILGLIARPNRFNSINIDGDFKIVSEGTPIAGETLNKVGRTTGRTQGQVIGTCIDSSVSKTNFVLRCQYVVNARVGSGDSGSPVFKITNNPQQNDVELRGILWGGNKAGTYFVFSPIESIKNEIGNVQTH